METISGPYQDKFAPEFTPALNVSNRDSTRLPKLLVTPAELPICDKPNVFGTKADTTTIDFRIDTIKLWLMMSLPIGTYWRQSIKCILRHERPVEIFYFLWGVR
jgi:hypothetical protein